MDVWLALMPAAGYQFGAGGWVELPIPVLPHQINLSDECLFQTGGIGC